MQVNKKIATEVMPLSLVAVVAVLMLARIGTGIYERINPSQFLSKDLVQWKQPLEGLEESRLTGKPVFMYFSGAGYIHKDEEYRRSYFSDQKIADDINANYIPVKVWDKSLGKTPKDPLVVQMQDKYLHWYTQPSIHVVPPECQLVHNQRHSLPHFYTISAAEPRKSMFSFVDSNKSWHPLPVAPSNMVHWTRIEDAQAKAKLEAKPVLYFFARHNDEQCNEAMRQFFDEKECKNNPLGKYICCMVYDHTPTGSENSPTVSSLISKYKIQTYPSFVVDKASVLGQNDKIIGYRGHDSMEEFLANNR